MAISLVPVKLAETGSSMTGFPAQHIIWSAVSQPRRNIILNRVRAEGNAGNQIKVTGQTTMTNSVLVGNCAFFENQPFTYWVDHCRALGNTLAAFFTGGDHISIVNSTVYGQGDGLVMGGIREGFQCTGAETLTARNSIFVGDTDYFDSSDITYLFYLEGCPDLKLDSDYSIAHNTKNVECGLEGDFVVSGAHDLCGDPLLAGPLSGMDYGLLPGQSSPALDAGDNNAVHRRHTGHSPACGRQHRVRHWRFEVP
jgi:hypothetical protein